MDRGLHSTDDYDVHSPAGLEQWSRPDRRRSQTGGTGGGFQGQPVLGRIGRRGRSTCYVRGSEGQEAKHNKVSHVIADGYPIGRAADSQWPHAALASRGHGGGAAGDSDV